MKHFGKRLLVLTAAFAMTAVSLAGCGTKLDNNEIVAEVGGEQIPAGVANFYVRMQQAQYETYYSSFMGEDMWSTEISEGTTYEDSMKETWLQNLENMYLMEAHAAEFEVELTEEENQKIASAVESFLENNALENKEVISAEEEYITKVLELYTIEAKMYEAMRAGVDEEVSDEEAAQKSMQYVMFSYTTVDDDGNSVSMTDEEKAEVKEKAQNFADRMKDATDVELETAAAEAGVEVATLTFDSESTSLAAEVITAADALENEGDMTDVIETDSGCYIAKLTSLFDREATDSKKAEIVEERKSEQYTSLLEQWREETEIKEYEKVWKKISFVDQGVILKQEDDEEYAGTSDTSEE